MFSFYSHLKIDFTKVLRFGIVGSIGTVINFTVYYVMAEIATLGLNVSAIAAFSVAVTINYAINHQWTFRAENGNHPLNLRQFTYYLLGNLVGLLVNLFVLNVLVAIIGIQYHLVWQMLGIACGMVFNFAFAMIVVFPSVWEQPGNEMPENY
jgi:putative flippase GtrA